MTFDLPPSTNALYQRRRGGQVALTKEAHRFRNKVKAKIVSNNLGEVNRFPVNSELIYRFSIRLYFEKLENPGWFDFWEEDKFYTRNIMTKGGLITHRKGELKVHKGERKAKTRYKALDYDNRIKFLQDCVSKAVGIPDDSQIFGGAQEKREDPDNPRAEVIIEVVDRSLFFPQ